MPIIYLSPSTQEFNPYISGGNEEQYMNLIADAMEPYLAASGIQFVRNTPEMAAATSIAASNNGNYDFHLALHSNASGSVAGSVRGSEVYYSPSSVLGQKAATIIANNLRLIYPLPSKVRTVPTTTLGEVNRTKAPAVLIEFAYHDNYEDAEWIKNNIDSIAQNVVLSLTEYFGIPFNMPQDILVGAINNPTSTGANMYEFPSENSRVKRWVPNGSEVISYNRGDIWSVVGFDSDVGYMKTNYVTF
jgi:N-acetylmuramoyl-L-alanine amidase